MTTMLRFKDGPTVDARSCPAGIQAFSHWNADGSCKCPSDAPKRKWKR